MTDGIPAPDAARRAARAFLAGFPLARTMRLAGLRAERAAHRENA